MSHHKRHHIDARDVTKRPPGMHTAPVPSVLSDLEETHFRNHFRDAAYYSTGRDWNDYAPAYRYGYAARAAYRGRRFIDVEHLLARDWNGRKGASRLLWAEARGAVMDAWHYLDEESLLSEHASGRSERH